MTPAEFRRVALSLPQTEESSHMAHPDFRVDRKVFATLRGQREETGMVKLTPDQQRRFVESHPDVFDPVKGAWGLKGATDVALNAADKAVVRDALAAAWRNTVSRRIIALLDGRVVSGGQTDAGSGARRASRSGGRTPPSKAAGVRHKRTQ